MAITDAQIAKLRQMCPAAREVDLGLLIQTAEAGGLTAGDGIDITGGAIEVDVDDVTVEVDGTAGLQVKDGGIGTDQIDDEAVTLGKLATAVQSGIVANALASGAAGEQLIRGQITLAAASPTTVQIASGNNNASLLSSVAGNIALTVGNTFIVNPNGVGAQTWTVAGTAGTSTGDTDCDTNMAVEPENKLKVAVDGGAAVEFTFDWTAGGGCDTGAKIATQMQTVIRAGAGDFAAVLVAYSTDHYVITSGNKGTGSAVVVTPAADHDCSARLALGVINGGTEAVGTGDVPILARATPAQVAAKIAALHAALVNTTVEATKVRLNATTTGGGSSLVLGNGTENTALGFTNALADYGDVGLSLGHAMANSTYTVMLTPVGTAPGTNPRSISVNNKAAGSFDIYQENAGAIACEVLVIGVVAA